MKSKKVKDENMEINPYEVDKLAKVPSWLKILLLRYWAAAAASFLLFGISELGMNIFQDSEVAAVETNVKLILLLGLFLAIFNNYIVRLFVRLMYNRRDNTYKWNLINFKGLLSFFVALLYNFLMAILIYILIVGVLAPNHLVFDPFGTTDGIGIEPFTVGFIYLIIDGVFIIIKNLIVAIAQRVKYNNQIKDNTPITPQNGEAA